MMLPARGRNNRTSFRAVSGCAQKLGSVVITFLLLFPGLAAAQTAEDDPCRPTEHRALDGRLGTWYQTTPDDRLMGETEVRRILGGCALWQDWYGASGGVGASLNAYDASGDVWRNMWVNSSSIVLLSERHPRDEETMLWHVSHVSIPKEEEESERWIWSLEDPVFNRVEVSEDGGESWSVVFDDRFHQWEGSLPPNERPSFACSLELEHHALAFWTGAWSVHAEDGRRVGDSRVDLILKGCAMREEGRSEALGGHVRFMAFDRLAGVWRLLLVTDRGTVRVAEGVRDGETIRWCTGRWKGSGRGRDGAGGYSSPRTKTP